VGSQRRRQRIERCEVGDGHAVLDRGQGPTLMPARFATTACVNPAVRRRWRSRRRQLLDAFHRNPGDTSGSWGAID